MFENIKKNKIESGVIIAIFIVVITLIVYYICHALELGPISIVIALIFSIASAFGSYYYSDKIVLSLNKIRFSGVFFFSVPSVLIIRPFLIRSSSIQ